MIYTKKHVYEETLKFFDGDDLATNVWIDKYALRDKKENFLENNPMHMYERVASELNRIERTYDNPLSYGTILRLLLERKFIPAGSNLFGIGNDYQYTSLANCFVIGNTEDSYSGLLQTDAEQALLMKRRGGVGHDISHLRPKGSLVQNAAKTSTGSVSFMNRFSNTTREVGQGGRRGALMLTMIITHPDIFDFITAKDDLTKITGANISVRITDEFMEAVKKDKDFVLRYPHIPNLEGDIDELPLNETITNKYGYMFRKIKARQLWNVIIKQAHKNGEPGLLFWDNIVNNSPADCYEQFQTKSTNPCGEVPLSFYDSCRLASMILPSYVVDPFTKNARFDFDLFAEDVEKAQRLMDDTIDLEKERIEAILEKINKEYSVNNIESVLWQKILTSLLDGRRTGLGTLGLADALAMLNIPYGSPESIRIAEDIHKSLALGSYSSSIILAKERGCFTAYDYKREKDHIFIRKIYDKLSNKLQKEYEKYGRRNISNLSIAPTGTLAILTGYSSGIEPVFKLFYNRKRRVDENHPNKSFKDDSGDWWEEYKVLHLQFKKYLKQFGDIDEKDLHKYIEKSPYYNVTTEDIYPVDKIKLQSAIQQWIDHSISITHNVSEDTTYESIESIYFKAWETGCKGSTVYRQNSRLGVLTSGKPEEKFKQHDSIKRPKDVPCDIYIPTSKGQKYVVCIGIIDNHPFEIFAFDYDDNFKIPEDKGILRKVKKGYYDLIIPNGSNIVIKDVTSKMSQSEEDRTRMISTALRHGADIKFVVEQLRKSKGDITTFSKVIARVLSKYINSGTLQKATCPVCNATLVYEGGCNICKNCGFSKCE
jgi:ribonucleoside-diphosphate reductase alpha chain